MAKSTLHDVVRKCPHRYTMEHIPSWAKVQAPNGKYYAPQYASDKEWYDRTSFPGDVGGPSKSEGHCVSLYQTWPLGYWLEEPYKEER